MTDVSEALSQVLGDELLNARAALGLSQRKVALMVPSGLDPHCVEYYETAQRPVRMARLVGLCAALDMPPALIVDRVVTQAFALLAPLVGLIRAPASPQAISRVLTSKRGRSNVSWMKHAGVPRIERVVQRAVGVQLGSMRRSWDLTQNELRTQLPSRMAFNSLTKYETGIRDIPADQFVEVCCCLCYSPGDTLEKALKTAQSQLPNNPAPLAR